MCILPQLKKRHLPLYFLPSEHLWSQRKMSSRWECPLVEGRTRLLVLGGIHTWSWPVCKQGSAFFCLHQKVGGPSWSCWQELKEKSEGCSGGWQGVEPSALQRPCARWLWHVTSQTYHFGLSRDCCWAQLTSGLSKSYRTQFMMVSHGQVPDSVSARAQHLARNYILGGI